MAVACRYGRWAAHFAWRYSSSGVMRLVRVLDKGCTTRRGVRAVRWQAHDHSRGLFTVTLPYTVRSTVERLSLWLKAAPQRRQLKEVLPLDKGISFSGTRDRIRTLGKELDADIERPVNAGRFH